MQSQASSPSKEYFASAADASPPFPAKHPPAKLDGSPQNLEEVIDTAQAEYCKDLDNTKAVPLQDPRTPKTVPLQAPKTPKAVPLQDPKTPKAVPLQDPKTPKAEPNQDHNAPKAVPSQNPSPPEGEPSQHGDQVLGAVHSAKTSLGSQASAEPAQAFPAARSHTSLNATAGTYATVRLLHVKHPLPCLSARVDCC